MSYLSTLLNQVFSFRAVLILPNYGHLNDLFIITIVNNIVFFILFCNYFSILFHLNDANRLELLYRLLLL